ncbi:MAG: hypothetical protein AAGI17_09325 [Planctomycetota bacterium]
MKAWKNRIGLGVLGVAAAVGLGGVSLASGATSGTSVTAQPVEKLDELVMRDGRVIRGVILSENTLKVEIRAIIGGIEATVTYDKINILAINRDIAEIPAEGGAAAAAKALDEDPVGAAPRVDAQGRPIAKVYHATLDGFFGRDIVPEVLRDIVDDARDQSPDYLILELDNEWFLPEGTQGSFDQYAAVEELEPILTTEIQQTWDNPPQIIVWVKNAMGGASMIPFTAPTIYFHPQGRMGGIGSLDNLFDGVGDEVVRQKQRSLRLARAQGIAIKGGYDYRLVNALARKSYELSYKLEGGRAILMEGYHDGRDEYVLTDNGEGNREDSEEETRLGTGNDVLTLRGREAVLLGVAEDTLAETLDDILDDLGVRRGAEITTGRSEQLKRTWKNGIRSAERELEETVRDMNEFQGDTPQQTIGYQIRKHEEIQRLVRRYGTALDLGTLLPPNMVGQDAAGTVDQIDLLIELLRIELIQANR